MARQIALEWDDREARLIVAQCRGGNVRVEHALTAPLPAGESGSTPAAIGEALASLLALAGAAKSEAIVVIGRTSIELRRLKLPPAPPEELPDLARFQAVREFTNFGDDWALDFEVLSSVPDDATWVLAAVLSPQVLQHAHKVAEAAGLTMSHLLLRPFAAASLFESSTLRGASHAPLLIDTAAGEADLTALADDRVIFTRTVKLSGTSDDDKSFGANLSSEIRRTMVAAQNQQAGYKVDQIVLCDEKHRGGLAGQQIGDQLGIPVRVLDPFEVVDASALADRPAGPGRFASLVGALLEESREERHAIDFLDPKRRPPPPDTRRTTVLAGAAAALLVLLLVGGVWWRLGSLERQIREATAQSVKNRNLITERAFDTRKKELAEINKFVEGKVTWIDELKRISEAAPPPNQAIVSQWRAGLTSSNNGRVTLEGVVAEYDMFQQFESRLRDAAHSVDRREGTEDTMGELPWRFEEVITIDPSMQGLAEEDKESVIQGVDAGGASAQAEGEA